MQFNEFNRRLEKCHLDEDTKYLMSHLFETVVELNKQMDSAASLLTEFARTIGNVVDLHGDTQAKVNKLMNRGKTEGVDVYSVRREPEDF
jgi:hypothetical protein